MERKKKKKKDIKKEKGRIYVKILRLSEEELGRYIETKAYIFLLICTDDEFQIGSIILFGNDYV